MTGMLLNPFWLASGGGGGGGEDPVGGGFGVHEFWRVNMTEGQNTGQVRVVAELEMAEVEDGPDLCSGGTPIGSHGSALDKSYAFDGDQNTDWSSGGSATGWIGYQFNTPVDLAQIRLAGGGMLQNGLRFGTVDYSDDGTTWTTAWNIVMNYPIANVFQESPQKIGPDYGDKYRVWRLFVIDNNNPGQVIVVGDVEFRETSGGPDLVDETQMTINSEGNAEGRWIANYSGGGACFNADQTDYWTGNSGVTDWVGWVFPDPVIVTEVAITGPDVDGLLGHQPRNMTLDYWDGTAWVTKYTFAEETGWTRNETRVLVPE